MAETKQYIFFDFEMLCSNRGMSFEEMEGIRLGAVKYDLKTKEVTYFDQYIRPCNPRPLSSFCKKLTGIKDEELQGAETFKIVFEEFLSWVRGIKKSRFFSWSTSDLTRLKLDAKRHEVPITTIKKIEMRYIDFQAIFTKRVSKNNPSVENALEFYGLSFIGEKHNPMYDSYNTLRIYLNFLNLPFQTDIIMLKQFIFDEVPPVKEINNLLNQEFQKDINEFTLDLKEIYRMKDAGKIIKRTRRMVEKYENILINRSGIFSKENVWDVGCLVEFYHELLFTFEEHSFYSSKVMILDEHILHPIHRLYYKEG
ncbi:3'-5' exonuclease [Evansella tamaricis]|uniref:Exonuclease domain-containing protein n=1 Tax=Evansella tamaricis TaxID=2069301 RepID=A0ABS6JK51_9BACI|nr:3'-5' exonuclease [Evansella tamaricis]MBU9714062.1 exonuclease domain-containing protein [Evansella tamaricis]